MSTSPYDSNNSGDKGVQFIDGDGQFSAMSFRIQCNVFFERLHFRGSPARAVSKTIGGGDVFIDDCVFEENGNALYVRGVDKTPYDQGAVYVKNSVFQNNFSTDAADGAGADGHPSLDTHQKMAEELAALLRTLN